MCAFLLQPGLVDVIAFQYRVTLASVKLGGQTADAMNSDSSNSQA